MLGRLNLYNFLKTKSLGNGFMGVVVKLNPDNARVYLSNFKATVYTQHYIIKRKLINKSP